MITINLLVEDDYIETFVNELPKDKVIIIEQEFLENKKMLENELENYKQNAAELLPYFDSMKELSKWLKSKEI